MSGNILPAIFSTTHGILFCNAETPGTIAVIAAVPAFFAIAVFFVAASVV